MLNKEADLTLTIVSFCPHYRTRNETVDFVSNKIPLEHQCSRLGNEPTIKIRTTLGVSLDKWVNRDGGK